MLKRLRYIILLTFALLSVIMAAAQSAMPDYVYIGAIKTYNVDPTPGSTYTWWIDGAEQTGQTGNFITISWTNSSPNPHKLEVQEHPANGCDGPIRSGEVYVSALPTPPEPFIECVEKLLSVSYNPATRTVDYNQPDYYTFTARDTRLDLVNFTDNGSPACPLKIGWRIDFSLASDPSPPHNTVILSPITGTGQPSSFGSPIHLPGDGIDYRNVTHTITYWIEDCDGKHVVELGSQTITIKPRPKIE
jgi:hypothetical protein